MRDIATQYWMTHSPGQAVPSREDLIASVAYSIINFSVPADCPFTGESVAQAIMRHYWMREIGQETVALWQYMIQTRLSEIIPKYSEIAKAQSEMGSVFENVNIGETGNRSIDRSNSRNKAERESGTYDEKLDASQESATTAKGATEGNRATDTNSMRSDTPQNGLTDVIEGKYLTDAAVDTGQESYSDSTDSSGSSTQTNSSTVARTTDINRTGNENGVENVKETEGKNRAGFSGDKAKVLWDYSRMYVNVFQMIIGEVADMFMGVLG